MQETFENEYSGQAEVDHQCITRYLNHPIIHSYYDELLSLANKGDTVSGRKMHQLTENLLPTVHLKNCHRQEIWRKFTLGHWYDAIQGPDCAFPYVHKSQVNMEKVTEAGLEGRIQRTEWGKDIYVRENLNEPDPLVIDDPIGNGEELMVGKSCMIKEHKTGMKYKAYVWFSLYDCCYLRAYESIRNSFLESIGKDGKDRSLPFFINSIGGAYMGPTKRMNWTHFIQINQCGKFTSHKTRKIWSAYIKNQKSALLSEGKRKLVEVGSRKAIVIICSLRERISYVQLQ